MTKSFKYILLLFILILSCVPDAPHDNPLDIGRNTSVDRLTISGQVVGKNLPHSPIENCQVGILPERQFANTDIDGKFFLYDIETGPHTLLFTKSGFDSLCLAFDPDTFSTGTFYLNGQPQIQKVKITSEYIDQWWPDPEVYLNAVVTIADPDGNMDVKNVFLILPDTSHMLSREAVPDSFLLSLEQNHLKEKNLFSLVGRDLFVRVLDKSESNVQYGPFALIRIIDESPVPDSPFGLEVTGAHPLLKWEEYLSPYYFSFEILMYRVSAGVPVLLRRIHGLPSTTTQLLWSDSLSTGTYFWAVGIRDELGNFCRSKESSFIVP